MTDDEIRALVERLEKANRILLSVLPDQRKNFPDGFPLAGVTQLTADAAAALTALADENARLAAERDEARAAYRLVTDCEPDVRERRAVNAAAIKEARRAAFARAREIAEAWRPQSVATGFALDLELWAASQIAAAIEAEMQSEEQKP